MRLFVALDLPWTLKDRLSGLSVRMQGVRWVPPENYHITLRFIGEAPAYVAEELDLALAGLRARGFSLVFSGVGITETSGRMTALWAGVERNPALDHLRGKVERALQRAGAVPDRRRFTPHVTLARLDGMADPARVVAWVQSRNLFRSEPLAVERFTLFSSRLGKEQAAYTPEVDYALAS